MIKKTLEISILYKGAHATIISLLPAKNHQIPLIHIVHEDDVVLLNTQDADEKEKEPKKSRSKPTKRCRCKDRQTCGHEWELADEGAGTIVKSGQKMRRKNRYV